MNTYTKSVFILSDTGTSDEGLNQAFNARGFAAYDLGLVSLLTKKMPALPPKAIVLKVKTETTGIKKAIQTIKAAYPGMNVPVLALLNSTLPLQTLQFDSSLLAPYHPVQVVLRTFGLIRLAEMEQEISLRLQTLEKDFQITPELPEQEQRDRFKILFIGKASPEFMIIINALQKEHVNVVAAFTSFTAFDYLYEQTFDAVVMNGLGGREPAFSVVQTMRKNAKLYHVPALLLVDSAFPDQNEAYNIGINDIIDAKAPLEDISSRILEQANFHRTHMNLKYEFSALGGTSCIDDTTGLYNRGFFNAHIARISKVYDKLDLPISLCLIRVCSDKQELGPAQNKVVYKQIGSMIKNLVRMHDITARLNENVFAIAFPGQTTKALKPVADRISSILKCTSISDPDTGRPLDLELEITFNQLENAQKSKSA
ncbi:MAG: hypothetical protein COA69_04960 [Robiginitomaculum sp.]|nr:MAG: hypothetical protein COA69_04960 [Robiginitomaculum sp.]